jgi:hypothetical protein
VETKIRWIPFINSLKKPTLGLILRILQNQAEAEEVLMDVYTDMAASLTL